VDDGVLLVGDAAGLAYAQSGEGIAAAIESGRLAAAAVTAAAGRFARERFSSYERALESRFGPRSSQPATALLPQALRAPLAGLVLAVPFLSRRLVLDPAFLHRRQRALTDTAPYFALPTVGYA
jgi:hypothetical protein